jgi:tetraacyldisaccharide 4'-kinase
MVAREWVSALTNQTAEPPPRVVAFCGLGNPRSFWRSLDSLGIHPLVRLEFDDHFQYAPRDLRAVARYAQTLKAEALLTTEKDVVNFPDGYTHVLENLPVLWLRAEVVVEEEEKLLEIIGSLRVARGADALVRSPAPWSGLS